MITVYGVPRSRAVRPLWMLEELGVPYQLERVSFVGETRTPEFLKLNPNGHIPVLRDGDLVIWESMAINLYLARKYDTQGLWPRTPEDEGRAFQWSFWAITELEEPTLTTLMHRRLLPAAQRDAKKADDAAERFKKPLAVLEGALATRPNLLGDTFTVADLNVAAILAWAPLAGLDLSAAPKAAAWVGRAAARPAFQRVQKMA